MATTATVNRGSCIPPLSAFMIGHSGLVVVQKTRTTSDSSSPRSHVADSRVEQRKKEARAEKTERQ